MKKLISIVSSAAILIAGLVLSTPAQANPVTVSLDSGSKSLSTANTTRKLAVASNGDIYALYSGSTGNHVAKSTTAGLTFSTSSATVSPQADAEIAVSSDGTVYVTWVQSSTIKQIKSTDGAATWSAPYTVGSSTASSVHTAVDREYVYVIARNGQKVFSSDDSGATWVESPLSATSWAYSDIAVDPLTGVIYPFVDKPQVSWFASNDRGLTFSSERSTGKSVFYSVAALGSNATTKYLYLAGGGDNLERLNLANNQITTATVLDPSLETSRTIAADGFGNVVTGGLVSGTLKFQVSQDFGATFASATDVVSGLASDDQSAIAINPLNGDVLVMYEKAGEIFLSRHSYLLTGYDVTLNVSYVDFSSAGTQVITLTNSSFASVTISTVELSNSVFTQTNTCTSALASNASCAITVTASSAGSATLRVVASGGIERLIPVAFGASPATVAAPAFTQADAAVIQQDNRYRGPVLDDPGSVAHLAGSTVQITGKKLDEITSIHIHSSTISFSAEANTMSIEIPAGLAPGKHDLEIKSRHGKLTHMHAIWVRETMLPTSLTIQGKGILMGEDFKKLTAFSRAQNPGMNTATCIVNSNSLGKSFMQARALCQRIASNNLNVKITMFESRSTVSTSAVFARVIFSSEE